MHNIDLFHLEYLQSPTFLHFSALLPNEDSAAEKKRQQMVEDVRVYSTMGIIISLAFLVTVAKVLIQKSFKEQEETSAAGALNATAENAIMPQEGMENNLQ